MRYKFTQESKQDWFQIKMKRVSKPGEGMAVLNPEDLVAIRGQDGNIIAVVGSPVIAMRERSSG